MSLRWRRRIPEWVAALADEKRTAGRIPWLTMVRAILDGAVPRRVWRERMRSCLRCPLFRRRGWVCRSQLPFYQGAGCGCYVPFKAITPEPYDGGCYGAATFPGRIGWPAYRMGRWERFWSVVRFCRGK